MFFNRWPSTHAARTAASTHMASLGNVTEVVVPAASYILISARPRTHTVLGVLVMFPEILRYQKLSQGFKKGQRRRCMWHFLQSSDRGRMDTKGAAGEGRTEKQGTSSAGGLEPPLTLSVKHLIICSGLLGAVVVKL